MSGSSANSARVCFFRTCHQRVSGNTSENRAGNFAVVVLPVRVGVISSRERQERADDLIEAGPASSSARAR